MQAKPALMDEAMRKAALKIVDTQDDYMSGIFYGGKDTAAINTGRNFGVTGGKATAAWVMDFFKKIAQIKRVMTKANHPMDGRWIVLPPEAVERIEAYLLTNASNTIPFLPATADDTIKGGFVGRILGYKVYVSNHLKTHQASSKTWINAIISSNMDACTLADKVGLIESYKPEKRFGEALKGLYVYASILTHSDRIYTLEIEQ